MKLIFCSDPLLLAKPDLAYEVEVSIAESMGLDYALISYEALVDENNPLKAVSRVTKQSTSELGIYRGWMLKPESYKQLFDALKSRNIFLINTPSAYIHCHYLPESYSIIEDYTPKSIWIETRGEVSITKIMEILSLFGSQPIMIKDFVKSRKHEWEEACYIPCASDTVAVERVVRRFMELQGSDLNEGLVFRGFVEFEPLTAHSKSGMPLTKEFRFFFLDGEPIYSVEYWEEGDYQSIIPPINQFRQVAKNVQSRFFTMDVAKCVNGDWMIVELGDGQVAGLPENADVLAFYKALLAHLPI